MSMVVDMDNTQHQPHGYAADLHAAGASVVAGGLPEWLQGLKLDALSAFERAGFPTRDQEAWRFTDISKIVGSPLVPRELAGVTASANALRTARALLDARMGGLEETARLVFVDGVLEPALSHGLDADGRLVVTTIENAAGTHATLLQSILGGDMQNGFIAINTLMFQTGAFLRIKSPLGDDEAPERVVHLVHVATRQKVPLAYHPRHVVVADPGASAVVMETYLGVEGARYLVNGRTQIRVGAGANVDHVILQEESLSAYHFQAVDVKTESGSRFASHTITLGALQSRLDIAATLEGDGGDLSLQGVYVARGSRQVDHHTVVTHLGTHSRSEQVYRGVLDDRAKAVFDGLIHVAHGAQKTDASQSTRNLLLSDGAVVHAQPRLEINADDVQCAHGATIGELDPEALFYLQSRGIGRAEARRLLIQGFLDEVIEKLPHPVLKRLVAQQVRHSLERPGGDA